MFFYYLMLRHMAVMLFIGGMLLGMSPARAQAIAAEPDKVSWEDVADGFSKGAVLMLAGKDFVKAREAAETALKIRRKLAEGDPKNADRQLAFSNSYLGLATVQKSQGDLVGVLESYQASVNICRKLVELALDSDGAHIALVQSLFLVGDAHIELRDLVGAHKSFQEAAHIMGSLVERVPDQIAWQRSLALIQVRLGDVQRMQGNFLEALKNFRLAMGIRKKIIERTPSNPNYQMDFAEACWKISSIPMVPQTERRALLEQGLALLDELNQSGKLRPDRYKWPDLFRGALQKLD